MLTTESEIQAVADSHLPRHLNSEGVSGTQIELEEWLEEQIRVGCKATLELLKLPRPMNEEEEHTGPNIPIKDEDVAYHLLMVHNKGMFHALESYREVTAHPEVKGILEDWIDHFGPLFNVMCKQNQIPYETSAHHVYNFQFRLVEHVQHLRRLFEQHSGGVILHPDVAWKSLDWAEPRQIKDDNVIFLRQSVYLPHVDGEGFETSLVIDAMHHTRESLMVRLSPYGHRTPF